MNHQTTDEFSKGKVLPGVDALREGLAPGVLQALSRKKIGLLTNHTGRARDGAATLAVLRELNLDVRALFSPEHGATGTLEGNIESSQTEDALPIHSLYGQTRRPTSQMLSDIEILVCDLQDVGARFYTYISTLAHCMEECAARHIAVVVLDRPNPLGGEIVEGPMIDDDLRSFVGYLKIPIRHGMTMGEMARLFQHDANLEIDLRVAEVINWKREMLWPQTGLEWRVPSPNLPDFQSAAWYPGTCLLEFSGLSVGRGTNAPFQIIGAPRFDAPGVLPALQSETLFAENFAAQEIEFTPTRGEHSGALCKGIEFRVLGFEFRVVPLGVLLLCVLHRVQPQEFDDEKLRAALPLLGSSGVLRMLQQNEIESALEAMSLDEKKFLARREEFLIYRD